MANPLLNEEKTMSTKVAIIGAGPAGLAQLRAFEAARAKGDPVPEEILCFERQADWGGQWNATWRTGLDEHGEPVHSSMYRHLWSNGPKECLEFADYSFDDHFGRPISSYPPREALLDYIRGRAVKDGVRQYIQFSTAVRWVDRDPGTGQFTLRVEDLVTGGTRTYTVDKLIVATGHFWSPNVPEFPGIRTFPGQMLHAHDFRGAESFAGKDLLLVGSSYSAEDIGMQAYKMGARSVTFSYRSHPMGYAWPDRVRELPCIEKIDGSHVTFIDGSEGTFDTLVLCTGYRHTFPFLPEELDLRTPNNLYPDGLYKGVVSQKDPNLFFVGMQDQYFTFNMFDAQAWFVRDVVLGTTAVPAVAEQSADVEAWLRRLEATETHEDEVDFQTDYVKDLISRTDYPGFDLDAVAQLFKDWLQDKSEDILGYRDQVHRSVMTGTTAAPHHTPWLMEMDDSLERYLSVSVDTAEQSA